ncbi:MoaD/ThiS family protein [Mycolicibacterium goodii]|uniref:Molybdopterin synthase sulfur carrier subunit n=1 Tax=Mycolicibacterium goodii TaxID=134601 RepID=A0A0K0X569_MYCGD|nr:molybdenum cofactor biosynthesis protein MoaD [Mycolicibacterium goodii]
MTTATTVRVTVRYFAAAAAAAGIDTETLDIATGTTVAELVEQLGARDDELARVLKRCSYLCDEIAVRDMGKRLVTPQTVDVLPPFAGG